MAPDSPAAYRLRHALLAQLVGLAVIVLIVIFLREVARADPRGIALVLAMLQGGIAALVALRQHAPPWWLAIHLSFAPLVVLVHGLDLPPGTFLAAFVVLLLLFWRTDRSRVPLYLSNRATAQALLELLPTRPIKMIDLGCGDGRLLRRLAKARPDCSFVGIEHAPLPWLLARLANFGLPNVTVSYGDFWDEPLGGYDLVYAFLSPAPMARLWAKACAEMPSHAILVSNSFPVPDADAMQTLRVGDRRATRLYCYRPARDR